MSFMNLTLLNGLGLATIPVILHFLLRSKPKKLVFPALRLIQARKTQNVHRLRLRHVWLLLLRIAVICLLVLAVSRPSLPAADYSLNLRETLTLLVIIAVMLSVYWMIIACYRRKRLPSHVFEYRRTCLKGITAVAAILVLLLLVAWPYQRRIAAEITAPLSNVGSNLPVAGVFLFDTSLSMQYRQKSQTRLQRAQEIALAHLANLSGQSRIAVAGTSSDSPILFQVDGAGSKARIESLETHAVAHPLNDRLRTSLLLQEADRRRTLESQQSLPVDARQDRFVREIYVFTDLAKSAWRKSGAKLLQDELQRMPWAHVYLIDVGVTKPLNVSVSSLKLSTQTLPLGGRLFVDVTIAATGIEQAERTLELYIQDENGHRIKQGQQTVKFGSETKARVQFTVTGLTGPINQGDLGLISNDPLSTDDVQYFTVEVRPPSEVLVVAPQRNDSVYVLDALAPPPMVRQGRARYRCNYIPLSKLPDIQLDQYATVCLIDVPALTQTTWRQLESYVKAGGGLAIFLGRENAVHVGGLGIDPISYNSDAAQAFLPAELIAVLPFVPPEHLDLSDLTHPILRKFEDLGGVAELSSSEVRKYWKVAPTPTARVIARYSNSQASAALLERSYGEGRTILVTSAAHLQGWNEWVRSWQFLALADQMVHYLSHRTKDHFNYSAGDEVLIHLDRKNPIERFLLRKPGFQQLPGDVEPGAQYVAITDVDQTGHYEVVGAAPQSKFRTGFSANASASESDFTELTDAELDQLLDAKRYSVARDIESLTRRVTMGRLGREVFSELLLVLIIVFCAEHLISNRFYQEARAVVPQ